MNIQFPDNLFKFTGNKAKFDYIVKEGKKICKDKKIFFCGVIRNGGQALEKNISRCIETAKAFKDFSIFIYENDSTDNTKSILDANKSEKVKFLSESRKDKDYIHKVETSEDPFHYHRCCVIADCRNKYVEYIENNNVNDKYDYICVLDFDIAGGWSYEGFYHSVYMLECVDDAACMSAYGVLADYTHTKDLESVDSSKYVFFDSFAFRPLDKNPKIHKNSTAFFNPIQYNRGEDIEEVISNFNGLAIYKSKYFKHKYKAEQWQHGFVDPDHVSMHHQIRNDGGKIFIDPNLIVSYSNHQHSRG